MSDSPQDSRPPRVLVCIGPDCNAAGMGKRIYARLEALLAEYDVLNPPFLLRTASCFDRCAEGPNMVIYPGNRRFSGLDEDRALAIIRREVLATAPPAGES
ncbi:MAG: (2Fe-2S) ferredoxin domain-containing protein [Anaerolineae bacterium]|nr:(2Fe-2S) ferredoxin domain-containing protein [Anaerolineae bacterium]